MRVVKWILLRHAESKFKKVFSDLKRIGQIKPSAKNTYELLYKLDFNTTDTQSKLLISELDKIQYYSNTSSFFFFYLPIVAHILYYKPKYEKHILGYLIEPNFANGYNETDDLISLVQSAMKFKISENKNYMSKKGRDWVLNQLPDLKEEVNREIQKYFNELKK